VTGVLATAFIFDRAPSVGEEAEKTRRTITERISGSDFKRIADLFTNEAILSDGHYTVSAALLTFVDAGTPPSVGSRLANSDFFNFSGFGVGVTASPLEPLVVPEPTTLLLFGTTAAGLGLARWRQRRRKQQQP
jgi:PEP-CTERM motif